MKRGKNVKGSGREDTSKRRRYNHALKNVISLRISDEELLFLQGLRAVTSKSMSDIMREAFITWQRSKAPGLDMNGIAVP